MWTSRPLEDPAGFQKHTGGAGPRVYRNRKAILKPTTKNTGEGLERLRLPRPCTLAVPMERTEELRSLIAGGTLGPEMLLGGPESTPDPFTLMAEIKPNPGSCLFSHASAHACRAWESPEAAGAVSQSWLPNPGSSSHLPSFPNFLCPGLLFPSLSSPFLIPHTSSFLNKTENT